MNGVVQLCGAGKRCDGLANPAAIQSLVTELVFNSFERVVVPGHLPSTAPD